MHSIKDLQYYLKLGLGRALDYYKASDLKTLLQFKHHIDKMITDQIVLSREIERSRSDLVVVPIYKIISTFTLILCNKLINKNNLKVLNDKLFNQYMKKLTESDLFG